MAFDPDLEEAERRVPKDPYRSFEWSTRANRCNGGYVRHFDEVGYRTALNIELKKLHAIRAAKEAAEKNAAELVELELEKRRLEVAILRKQLGVIGRGKRRGG